MADRVNAYAATCARYKAKAANMRVSVMRALRPCLEGSPYVEMKESRPSTRPPTRLSQAVRDHGGAGQLDPRTVIHTNTVPYFRGAVPLEKRLEVASDQDRFRAADSVADFSCVARPRIRPQTRIYEWNAHKTALIIALAKSA